LLKQERFFWLASTLSVGGCCWQQQATPNGLREKKKSEGVFLKMAALRYRLVHVGHSGKTTDVTPRRMVAKINNFHLRQCSLDPNINFHNHVFVNTRMESFFIEII